MKLFGGYVFLVTNEKICIALAQNMHRTEARLRQNLLPGSENYKIRPLNDAKAISNGANAISEGFLFAVAATIILGETYRSSRSRANHRDHVQEELSQLRAEVDLLNKQLHGDGMPDSTSLMASQSPSLPPSFLSASQTSQLLHAVQLLWAIAKKKGWFDEQENLPSEFKWLLEGDNKLEPEDRTNSDELTSTLTNSKFAKARVDAISKEIGENFSQCVSRSESSHMS
jgi:hypothetical protein